MEKETLEEAAERLIKLNRQDAFYEGAKWQAERMYSKEEVQNLIKIIEWYDDNSDVRPSYHTETIGKITMWDWFEQFKKKEL